MSYKTALIGPADRFPQRINTGKFVLIQEEEDIRGRKFDEVLYNYGGLSPEETRAYYDLHTKVVKLNKKYIQRKKALKSLANQ